MNYLVELVGKDDKLKSKIQVKKMHLQSMPFQQQLFLIQATKTNINILQKETKAKVKRTNL
jgi:hypothetical protein